MDIKNQELQTVSKVEKSQSLEPINQIESADFEMSKEIKQNQKQEYNSQTIEENNSKKYKLPNIRKVKQIPPSTRDNITIQVERILQDGLEDTYRTLNPIAQQEFKLKGEETAKKIREMLKSTKIKIKKIFKLIVDWLSILPGINLFFLEQEAKIKTDKIIELKKEENNI